MAIRNIRTEDDEVLRKKCKEVTSFDEKLWQLLDDMAETMYNANGVGLAAPQVGILKRVVVIDVGEGLLELINPQIISAEGEQTGDEGCLSCPNQYAQVTRPKTVKVQAKDRNGNHLLLKGSDLLARAFCHEIDHLDGIIFKDLVDDITKITK